jgi:hypothetical protein
VSRSYCTGICQAAGAVLRPKKNFDRPSDLVRLNQFVEPYLQVIGDKGFPFAT